MKQFLGLLALIWVGIAQAQYTFHIYSPWASDPLLINNRHHVLGGFSDWSANSNSQMTSEGNGWYSFTIPGSLTDWWDLTLKNCPLTSDQNCNGGETWSIKPKVVALLGGEEEVWVYPDASTQGYTVALIPPGAKVVWFKSPWGNKALPNMIVGSDTVRMRFSTDVARCGWFYGALRDGQITQGQVYFQQAFTSTTLPSNGVLDVRSVINSQDSVYVDGTSATIVASDDFGTVGTCMDTSKVVHVFHPWISDASRSRLPIYLHAGNLLGNYTAMLKDDSITGNAELAGWYQHAFPGSTNWSQNEVLDVMSYFPNPENSRLTFDDHPAGKELFPSGIYEVWLLPVGDKLKRIYAPVTARFVQFRNPWDNTVPKMIVDGDTLRMARIADTCGWYRGTLWQEPDSWEILFKQALGFEYYSMSGLENGTAIDVDSVMSKGRTVWITPNPYPNGAPRVGANYQGPPGDCPNRELAVMLFDWANNDLDFGKVYDGSDASDGGKCPGLILGMVDSVLGPTGYPVKSDSIPAECTAVKNLESWFLPKVLQQDYSNARCYDLPLSLDDEGFWLADIAADSSRKIEGFFPLDDFKFLDSANTIPNPKYELEGLGNVIEGVQMQNHNFLYSMHVNASFVYVPGQYFEFRGDDDVWVFINNKLVVDIGGVHGPLEGKVDLDTLGLTAGVTYPFHIFYAERNCCGANFKMRTSMDLQTDRTYYPVQVDAGAGIISYEIWQILKEKTLSCDFNSTASADTVRAASSFLLYGPMFPDGPKSLAGGVNYGGISISDDYTSFSIDTNAIVRDRSLAPGRYRLEFTHSMDASLSGEIYFTVPSYPLPSIVFTDFLGNVIDPDTVQLGEWAFQPYPVYLQARYVGVPCQDCTDELSFDTHDSLIFVDKDQRPIQSVKLDSGRAMIWVMGLAALDSASFEVRSASVQNELLWRYIDLKEPPVPFVRTAELFDRNGNGVGDSLHIRFSRSLVGKDAADSLFWDWAEYKHALTKVEIAKSVKDSVLILVGDSLAKYLFTGGAEESAYQGSLTSWFTYIPTDGEDSGKALPFGVTAPISDRMGALIQEAEMSPGRLIDTLFLALTESLPEDTLYSDSIFELKVWRNGMERSAEALLIRTLRKNGGQHYMMTFANSAKIVPGVGDSVRIIPSRGVDWSGNVAHARNPWVRIVGKQRARVESVPLVTIDERTAPGEEAPVTRIVKVTSGQDAETIAKEQGIPGHIIRYDLSNVIANSTVDLAPKDVELHYRTGYFTNLGGYINSDQGNISCADSIFNGDCTRYPGHLFIGWNLRSAEGRLAATGAYISSLHYEVKMKGHTIETSDTKQIWGVQRKRSQ